MRSVASHPGFIVTLLVAVAGWFAAFIGQCVTEAKYQAQAESPGSAVGVQWFGIFLQLIMIICVVVTLAGDSVARNRFQISVFLAITVVFAVFGVNSGIFADSSYQLAIGAGWILLAMVDILWLLYFSAEEDAAVARIFSAGARGQFTRGSTRQPSMQNSQPRGSMTQTGSAVSYQGAQSFTGKNGGPGTGPAGISVGDLSQGGDAGQHSPNSFGENGREPEFLLKARALYSYSASPDDPNEISFSKGEVLEILDNSGKWWQARKADGTRGIIPSNYMVLT
ncbi:Transmembrane osmosensor [Microbotryomycetes sp. JL201]|nr:Transmembrane osmosensor [Microbotryomycetes sp. JL201]